MFEKPTTADLKCITCKHAKDFTGCYCLCSKKKYNRVQISKQKECKKFEKGDKQ